MESCCVLQRAGLGKALGIPTLTVRGEAGCWEGGRSGLRTLESRPERHSVQVTEESHAQGMVDLHYFEAPLTLRVSNGRL